MGQTLSTGQYLINKNKKQIICIDKNDFLDKNIYNNLKKINEMNDWTMDDTVEYINTEHEKDDEIEYIKELVVVQKYDINPKYIPDKWVEERKST